MITAIVERRQMDGEEECSMTSPSEMNHDDEDVRQENIDEQGSENSNGESSSNSTVEENNVKKAAVRPYVRSKMQRLRWTPDLHHRFVHAVQKLGGQDRATPKLVLQMMSIKGLSIAHVKSHLQMYRSKKIDDTGQEIIGDHHRHFVEGGHGNIYSFSQLPILQGFNQRPLTSFRSYGDVSWRGHHENLIHTSPSNMNTKAGELYDIYGKSTTSNYNNISHNNIAGSSNFNNGHSTLRFHEEPKPQIKAIIGQAALEVIPSTLSQPTPKEHDISTTSHHRMKRKALEECELDLNLSLKVAKPTINDDDDVEEVIESDLSLSLYSSPSSKQVRIDERASGRKEHEEKRASTLDLTL